MHSYSVNIDCSCTDPTRSAVCCSMCGETISLEDLWSGKKQTKMETHNLKLWCVTNKTESDKLSSTKYSRC